MKWVFVMVTLSSTDPDSIIGGYRMRKRKTWIKVKQGILEKKHRERLGIRFWLYMYMLDVVDWDTGIIDDWKDKSVAKDMGMSWRTLQNQRQHLVEDGYITCTQKDQCQRIIIHNWTNPRKYSGKVLNRKSEGTESYVVPEEEKTESCVPPPNIELRTPSISTTLKTHISTSAGDQVAKPRKRDPLFDAICDVCKVDAKTAGSSVGKVTAVLRKAGYTEAEVYAFGSWWLADRWRAENEPLTVWKLKERIGRIKKVLTKEEKFAQLMEETNSEIIHGINFRKKPVTDPITGRMTYISTPEAELERQRVVEEEKP